MNPMVDGWMGDDWFHNGAFRQQNMPIHLRAGGHARQLGQVVDRALTTTTTLYLQAGSAGELGAPHGLEQMGFWSKILAHPSYDAFWQRPGDGQDARRAAAEGAGDAGRTASGTRRTSTARWRCTRRIEPKDTDHDKVFLVLGPWHHGQEIERRQRARARSDSAATPAPSSAGILRPFLDQYLKDDAPQADVAPVTAFETGTNRWQRLPAGRRAAQRLRDGCTPLYPAAGLRARLHRAGTATAAFDDYVSDPAKPVPFRARPIQPIGYDNAETWPDWLVGDQREASGRPDVLSLSRRTC